MGTQSRAIPVILTRPAEQGARFASLLTDTVGDAIRLIHSPVLAPRFLSPDMPMRPFSALIFTSQTAVNAVVRMTMPDVPLPRRAFCVGNQTCMAARMAGFDAVSGQGDARHLVDHILTSGVLGPLLHLRGQHTRGNVSVALNSAGIETHDAIIYTQDALPLNADARAALLAATPVVLPIFSPRTAEVLMGALALLPVTAPLFTVSLSQAVSDAWSRLPRRADYLADVPDVTAMVAAVQRALVAAQAA